MKSIKMLGLAALAALMAMAFVGASSAMATESTQLCQTETNPCKSAVTHVHETTLAGSPAILLNSIGNVECDVLFLSTVNEKGEPNGVGALSVEEKEEGKGTGKFFPQIIKGNFTYTNCFMGKTACTVTELSGPAEIKVLKEGHETAKVTGEGEVKVKCGAFINCTYNGEKLIGTAKGPLLSSETNGSVTITKQVTHKVSGFLCPAEAELDITTTPLTIKEQPEEGKVFISS